MIITLFIDPFVCVIAASKNSDSIVCQAQAERRSVLAFCDISYGIRSSCL